MKRVVVTGMAGITALGDSWAQIEDRLRQGQTGIRTIADWERFGSLNTRLGAPADFAPPSHYPRKTVRATGRVSLMSLRATEMALEQSGLLGQDVLTNGDTGIAYGSSSGSVEPLRGFGKMLIDNDMSGLNATSYVQMMPHTTAANTALFFGLKGRVIPTSSACTSGSQAIGYAYEAIRYGKQKIMIAGGAEELSPASAAVFDLLFATSTRNDSPELTPRPFDQGRDGLVVGEGAATLILEEYEHARARGATILAEIAGFGTNSDGTHITQPEPGTMAVALQLALQDARLAPEAIGYVSAHGTATDRGDIAESHATHAVLGDRVPISSMKSYLGHTLGACGAIEAWWAIEMMRRSWFAPTMNLSSPDPACAPLNHVIGSGLTLRTDHVMSNNFAFGGINTSLIFSRVE
ncbi:beta-ketoacyl-ACP synthase [Herbaspirillum sp. HC18]|nr:beta-ketoacyl-ACP synthase [Herbaspirillum sp. HC18]